MSVLEARPPAARPAGPRYAPVRALMLMLTEACNMRCSYCYQGHAPRRMTLETARRSVEFFLSRHISGHERSISIVFFGGEPFLELDLMEEVIAHTRRHLEEARLSGGRSGVPRDVTFEATTNGTIFNGRVEHIVRDARMQLLVSVDGAPAAAAHRPFASGASSYEALRRNLPALVRAASSVAVRMTYHPGALDLVGNVEHALALGAPSIALCPFLEGEWSGREAALEDAFQALADWSIARARRAGRGAARRIYETLRAEDNAVLAATLKGRTRLGTAFGELARGGAG